MSANIIGDYGGDIRKKCPICNKPFSDHLPWELIQCNDIHNGGIEA